ncbi:MAG: hypothetical protein ACLUHE_15750 [Christensenellales bacterium]
MRRSVRRRRTILGAFSAWLYNYLMIFVSAGHAEKLCASSSSTKMETPADQVF